MNSEKAAELREGRRTIAILGGAVLVLTLGLGLVVITTSWVPITTERQVQIMLGSAAFGIGFYVLLRLLSFFQTVERRADFEEERRLARYNRFMELLRDVRWNLLNRN